MILVLQLFPPDASRTELGRHYYGDKSPSALTNLVLDYLDELVKSGRVDSSWPRLDFVGLVLTLETLFLSFT